MLDKFMQQLAKDFEVASFATEVPGVYEIPVDEGIDVKIAPIPQGFAVTCSISDVPNQFEEEFYTQALIANLYGKGTEGCVLGLNSEGKGLTLSREIDYNIEYKEFADLIEDFLNSVDFWRQEAQAYGTKLG